MNVTPHVAAKEKHSTIDSRTTCHAGYRTSLRIRKRIEEAFGWIKTVAGQRKTKFRGVDRVGWPSRWLSPPNKCSPRATRL
jgi:hypothetical protein